MLSAGQIAALRDAAGKLTDPINEYLLKDIARRIAEAGQLTSTAAYQIWRAQQLGRSQREVERELRRLLQLSRKQIRKILHQSAQSGYSLDINRFPTVAAIPFEKNAALQQIVSAAVELAQDDFTNLTQTMGFVNPYGKAVPLTQAYRDCTDFAFKQVVTGAASYTEAVRQATRNLASKGVRVIDYESGVHTSLEAAVRRNIMGGLGLMQEKISQTTHDQLGCDGWEITAHANSAPDHEPIQGRQYPDAAYQALNDSLCRRIGTLNCGHTAFPIILGVNRPQYTPEELEKFRADNEKGVTVDGVHYTGYQATQMQRSLERAIRTQKRRVMVDEAAGDKEKLAQDETKLTVLRQRYQEFSDKAGLRTQEERTEVAGFGERRGRSLANSAGRGILNDTSGEGIPITEQTIQRVPLVRPNGWSQEQAERLQEAHRELLRAVQDKPAGTEAGRIYDPNMSPISKLIVGEPGGHQITIPDHEAAHIVIHSHPNGQVFSESDIRKLIFSSGVEMLTAVGNNGTLYVARKTVEYDGFMAYQRFQELQRVLRECAGADDMNKYIRAIEDFLKEGSAYGLEFIKSGA